MAAGNTSYVSSEMKEVTKTVFSSHKEDLSYGVGGSVGWTDAPDMKPFPVSPANCHPGNPAGFTPASRLLILPDSTYPQPPKLPPSQTNLTINGFTTGAQEERHGAKDESKAPPVKGPTIFDIANFVVAAGSKGKGPRGSRQKNEEAAKHTPKLSHFFHSSKYAKPCLLVHMYVGVCWLIAHFLPQDRANSCGCSLWLL